MKFSAALFFGLSAIAFVSCQKAAENIKDRFGANAPADQVVEHFIAKGAHSSDKNSYRPVNTTEMKFVVRFDSSAIYQTVTPDNQLDINKLYGFADNNQEHHLNSARIGWRWYNNSLQLFAYVYNNGVEKDKLITAVPLGQDINCSLKVSGNQYIITANGVQVTMERTATTETAVGYQLYPYFGGDEVAPQDIRIRIKDL
ncbi:MAG: hypothetical protein K0Q66_963 [Chitinophagaceae bacterium]|jgi:hypothetical protein|nr:hypothetical protein [Chitinophagaceae bacterium]